MVQDFGETARYRADNIVCVCVHACARARACVAIEDAAGCALLSALKRKHCTNIQRILGFESG
jgi:2-methylcitrate dehydratase PrpD